MPEQLIANPIGRTELDGLSNIELQIRIAQYSRLIHYYTTKCTEAIEELNQRIWHNEEDFWGLDRRENNNAND